MSDRKVVTFCAFALVVDERVDAGLHSSMDGFSVLKLSFIFYEAKIIVFDYDGANP